MTDASTDLEAVEYEAVVCANLVDAMAASRNQGALVLQRAAVDVANRAGATVRNAAMAVFYGINCRRRKAGRPTLVVGHLATREAYPGASRVIALSESLRPGLEVGTPKQSPVSRGALQDTIKDLESIRETVRNERQIAASAVERAFRNAGERERTTLLAELRKEVRWEITRRS